MQWNKVKTANYNEFNLIINEDYKKFRADDFVYDHEGNHLFFYPYNPSEIPVFNHHPFMDWESIRKNNNEYGIRWSSNSDVVNYYS